MGDCVSDRLELVVKEATGALAEARDKITLGHLNFLEGRDVPPDETYYHVGKLWKKVDVSRFQDIQSIADKFPDSDYAAWIRFWKVYHHASEEEALAYARQHAGFPLSDNLMFRVVQRMADDDARHDEATALLSELEQLFPEGDTASRARALREKLQAKRKR